MFVFLVDCGCVYVVVCICWIMCGLDEGQVVWKCWNVC